MKRIRRDQRSIVEQAAGYFMAMTEEDRQEFILTVNRIHRDQPVLEYHQEYNLRGVANQPHLR